MRNKILYIAAMLLGMAGFASCTGDQAQPPVILPEGGVGNGTWNSPMTVYQASLGAIANDTVMAENGKDYVKERELSWVTGYIVGYIDVNITNVMKEETTIFNAPATVATNIVMASDPNEKDWTKCISVQLPSGAVRSALNLQDHPENMGAQVTIYGITGQKYCSAYGVRSVSKYRFGDRGIFTPKTIFTAPFTNGDWAGFELDNGGDHTVWTLDNRYGIVGKGRFDNVNYDLTATATSPEIFLGNAEKPVLMFDWAANYYTNTTNFRKLNQVLLRAPGGEWEEAEIPVWPAGNSWDFVSSGQISLDAYKGGKVQIRFVYQSTTSLSGTFELRDLQVLDAVQLENAPQD